MVLTDGKIIMNVKNIINVKEEKDELIFLDSNRETIRVKHGIRPEIAMALAGEIVKNPSLDKIVHVDALTRDHIEKILGSTVYEHNLIRRLNEIRQTQKRHIEVYNKDLKRYNNNEISTPPTLSQFYRIVKETGYRITLLPFYLTLFEVNYYCDDTNVKCYIKIPFNNVKNYIEEDIERTDIQNLNDLYYFIKGTIRLR